MNEALQSFLDASMKHRSNAVAQSVDLALKFQLKPALMEDFENLASDYKAWEVIRRAARFPHRSARARQPEGTYAPHELDDEAIVRVLTGEATMTRIFMRQPRQVLERIAALGAGVKTADEYSEKLRSEMGIDLPGLAFER